MKHNCMIGMSKSGDMSDYDTMLWYRSPNLRYHAISQIETKFSFCPICGKTIDWSEIENYKASLDQMSWEAFNQKYCPPFVK